MIVSWAVQRHDRSEDEQLEFETAEVKHDCWRRVSCQQLFTVSWRRDHGHNNNARTEHSGSVSMSRFETVASELLLVVGSAATREVNKRAPIASEPASLTAREGEYMTVALIMNNRLPSALLLRR